MANEVGLVIGAFVIGITCGPTDVQLETVAKQHFRQYRKVNDPIFPEYSILNLREAAMARFDD
jgi:acyl-CoA dehydrogenase